MVGVKEVITLDDDDYIPDDLISNAQNQSRSKNSYSPLHCDVIILNDSQDSEYIADKGVGIVDEQKIHDEAVNELVKVTGQPRKVISEMVWDAIQLRDILNIDSIIEVLIDDILSLSTVNASSSSSNSSSSSSQPSVRPSTSSSSSRPLSKTMQHNYDDGILDVSVVRTPLQQVLAIFPLAKKDFVTKLLNENTQNPNEVISIMAEKGYEKNSPPVIISSEVEKDFTSPSSFTPSTEYINQAFFILQHNFPYFQTTGLKSYFNGEICKGHYSIALESIESKLGITASMEFNSRLPREVNPVVKSVLPIPPALQISPGKDKMASLGLKLKVTQTKNSFQDLIIMDSVLQEELRWLLKRKLKVVEQKDRQFAEEINVKFANEDGAMYECGCCCSEYPFEQIIQCSEGDLFCKNCLKIYVETTVFGNGQSHIKCMNSSAAGCTGYFPDSMLKNSLPEMTYKKYQEALMKDSLKLAKLEGICTCFNCSFIAELASDAGNVMVCPQCCKETCRLCQEESHVPLRCDEVEKKGETEVRLTVEEAMTNARIRQCPKCKTRFFKIEGCNKMSCSCGTCLCYICRADITKIGYTHFCQIAHCDHKKCNKCRLFTNTIEDDKQAMLEAGTKALQTQQALDSSSVESRNAGTNKVEIMKLLEGGSTALKKNVNPQVPLRIVPALLPIPAPFPIPRALPRPVGNLPAPLPLGIGRTQAIPPRTYVQPAVPPRPIAQIATNNARKKLRMTI